jgi:tetratricopeptide repeat protein 30
MISEIKTQASRQHPELLRSLVGDTVDFDAQGLILQAKNAFLFEALNLLSALDFDQRHFKEARDAPRELPKRNEDELDPVTLHNTPLVTLEDDPSSAFRNSRFCSPSRRRHPRHFGTW